VTEKFHFTLRRTPLTSAVNMVINPRRQPALLTLVINLAFPDGVRSPRNGVSDRCVNGDAAVRRVNGEGAADVLTAKRAIEV